MDTTTTTNNTTSKFQKIRRHLFICFPTTLLALLVLSYNGVSIFCVKVPFPSKITPKSYSFSSSSSSSDKEPPLKHHSSSVILYSLREETPLPLLHKTTPLTSLTLSPIPKPKPIPNLPKHQKHHMFKILQQKPLSKQFSVRAKEFFNGYGSNSSNSSCKVRFFMTWISSLDSFGYRELFTIESVFKSHPNACLLIVSTSLDTKKGAQLLSPFTKSGFRVSAISPDFDYLFKNTMAETWFTRLKKGEVDPGEVSLGQNLSNLLRLAVLYKFGGIYIDTDFIVLKEFTNLRNVIGAQTMDLETGNWSRLNNAVMIFDKKHPLLFKFIEDFALTFNGNKWGHNGPYLVSRVVARVSGRPGYNFTVLSPMAFYPVDWSRIQSLFHGPREGGHAKWMFSKLKRIREDCFGVHLWNKQSRNLTVEEGSVISRLMFDSCVFCNFSGSISGL